MKKLITIFFSLFFLVLLVYLIYNQVERQKVPGKLDRLECHKNITCFEKIYKENLLDEAKEFLYAGNYTIRSGIDKATFMDSTLFQYVSVEDTEQFLYNYLSTLTQQKHSFDNGIIIDFTIYENDKEDPKKKSDKCKLFRGYVVLQILSPNKELIYKVQIDFMDQKGKDIPKALECALKSLLTY
jgi:hypothetical protein